MRNRLVIFVSAALLACTCAAVLSSAGAGASSSPRHVAEKWVGFMAGGSPSSACRLQTTPEVGGVPCGRLKPPVFHCPKQPVGAAPVPGRTPKEQVLKVTAQGTAATAVIASERRSSGVRGTLGLKEVGGRWRVAWLSLAGKRYAPAGEVATNSAGRASQALWPACVRFTFPGE